MAEARCSHAGRASEEHNQSKGDKEKGRGMVDHKEEKQVAQGYLSPESFIPNTEREEKVFPSCLSSLNAPRT